MSSGGNERLQTFYERLTSRFAGDRADLSYGDWICLNTTIRKRPFSFDGYPFQKAIADDMSRDLSVIKLSQVGMTEIQIRKSLAFIARNTGVTAIFTLPTDEMVKRVSQTRVKPLISHDDIFNLVGAGEAPVRSQGLYQVNDSFIYFTGNKEGDATSIPADALFHDETDLSNQSILGLFQSRLQNSDWRITHNFSTPTIEGFGIDAKFSISDQHEYMVKCDGCNHWNLPDLYYKFLDVPGLPKDLEEWEHLDEDDLSGIDMHNSNIVCEKCRRPLDLGSHDKREWVAKFPGRQGRGYRIRLFSTPRLSPYYAFDQLIKYKSADNLKGFYNTVLGRAYNDSNARLNDEEIKAVMTGPGKPDISDHDELFVGIDMGNTCHIIIGKYNEKGGMLMFDWRKIQANVVVDEVESILKQYNVVAGCVDRHPFSPIAEQIYNISSGKIIPVEYRGQERLREVANELGETTHLQANRTRMLDTVVSGVRNRYSQIAGYGTYERDIIHHLQDMVRMEFAERPAEWKKVTGNDHFFHAAAFLQLAPRYIEYSRMNLKSDTRVSIALHTIDDPSRTQRESRLGSITSGRRPLSIGRI